tara:strand:+ start:1122 stop:2855 length:1734 start_codon:yes stop_codon:yes gene_type:complete
MSQKLIRLTCQSNDGVFDGLFDEDIKIKKDSKIAFQSLSLERSPPPNFVITAANNTLTYVSREDGVLTQTATIPLATYETAYRLDLISAMEKALNSNCNFNINPSQMNSQWKVMVDDGTDKVEISCIPSPFFPLACYNTLTGAALYNTWVETDEPVLQGVANAAPAIMYDDGLGRGVQSGAGELNECYMYSRWPFIKSTGSLRVRLADMTEGTDNRPAFTIGLVDQSGAQKLLDGTIELTDLEYAIQVNQKSADPAQGGYSYINTAGSAAVTLTAPFVKISNATPGQDRQDVFEIIIGNDRLQGFIHQEGGVKTTLPVSTAEYSGRDLFAVIFIHLATAAAEVNMLDMIQCSFDTNPENFQVNVIDANPQIEGQITADQLATLTRYDNAFVHNVDEVSLIPFKGQFEFANDAIAQHFGFTEKILVENSVSRGGIFAITPTAYLTDPISGIDYLAQRGYTITATDFFQPLIDNETFLVDTQTFTLDSYDSYGLSANERNANSGGSRRNLLATIPVIETPIEFSPNLRVIYEPNTLDYIAIKNRSDIITRQIRMRLLDARYEPVTTVGLAAMTILISEP